MVTKIPIEDCPPRRKREFHPWMDTAALVVGVFVIVAAGWIILKRAGLFPDGTGGT